MSKSRARIHTHFVRAGRSIFSAEERALMTAVCREKDVSHMVVLDQGSCASPPLVEPDTGTKVLIVDHHQSQEFPEARRW
jgi:hypothetical protein